jgi:hypothetical protein
MSIVLRFARDQGLGVTALLPERESNVSLVFSCVPGQATSRIGFIASSEKEEAVSRSGETQLRSAKRAGACAWAEGGPEPWEGPRG